MARGKKHGGGRGDERRKRVSDDRGAQNRHHNGKRHRSQQSPANAPSAAFLAALEAQRAKEAVAEDAPVAPLPAAAGTALPPATSHAGDSRSKVSLPGFYYDEAKKRYFKVTKQHRVEQKRLAQAAHLAAHEHRQRRINVATAGRALRRRGWMGFLAERQLLAANAVLHRDHRDLMPRFFATRFAHQHLTRVVVAVDATRDRFTAMDMKPESSTVCLGYSRGHVRSFTLPAEENDFPAEIGSIDTNGLSVSCVRHHRGSRSVLVAAVGAPVQAELTPLLMRGESRTVTGRLGLFSDSKFDQPPQVWQMNDPWVVEWSPDASSVFSVGLGAEQGAALVDCTHPRDGRVAMTAPRGRIKSDTLCQTFSQQSSAVILNGTRNGSWWVWDTRAPRRATEVLVNSRGPIGSLQCIRLLRDDRRLVTQRSVGELAVLDLRSPSHLPVTSICTGAQDIYRSMLRFDVDENETVITAATFQSVGVFDLSRGTELARLRAPDAAESHPVEQVILQQTPSEPTLWTASRSAVYRSRPT